MVWFKDCFGLWGFFIVDCHICHEEKVGCTSFSVCLSSFQVVPNPVFKTQALEFELRMNVQLYKCHHRNIIWFFSSYIFKGCGFPFFYQLKIVCSHASKLGHMQESEYCLITLTWLLCFLTLFKTRSEKKIKHLICLSL